ncbi:alpha/beta hydrolase [Nocardia sp. NBC_00565]|uniref:alpha/beta hydrolase n=1 Tax=Nocardia sp. NBC_00565 TaxID=2975993 RepID=UPI003FA5E3AF
MNRSASAVRNARGTCSVTNLAFVGLLVPALTALGVSTAPVDPVTRPMGYPTEVVAQDGSRITDIESIDNRHLRLRVYSAAMDETFPVEIQRPADTSRPRPSLYLLNGAGGGEDDASWQAQSDAREFMSDKNVNLIMPVGGRFSYYADWIKDDPVLGRNKWKTYLTDELPPLINAALNTNGVNAIAGVSTSATTVLALPIAEPGLYKAAAAYSGCVQTSDPMGARFVKLAVAWGGGSAENMWGPADSPGWAENDPYLHAERLRGLDMYISSGNGLPGKYETLEREQEKSALGGMANQILVGGLIEAATNYCAHNLQAKLNSLDIPATYHFTSGTHSWGYWQDELKRSWPVLARGMGVSEQ